MSFPSLSAAVSTAARSARATTHADVTEGELLRAYTRSRAEAPFADLVRRLGPMVLGVCRRVSGDRHLAVDAFQAAFAVLARRAGDVRPAEAVCAWLYGVAVRTAREARAVSARRLVREVPMSTVPDRAHASIHERDADALAILDLEIANLPKHLRSAVVICEIDGVSRKDAAKRLGLAEGTLSSRLAKARKLLAQRLRKRGVSFPAAGLAVLAEATVSTQLAAQTSALISSTAPLSPAVAALTHRVLRTMFFQKLTIGTAFGILLAVMCLAAQLTVPNAAAKKKTSPKPPTLLVQDKPVAKPQPASKPAGPGRLLVWKETQHVLLTPDGKEDGTLDPHPDDRVILIEPVLSPDGKRVAFAANENPPTDNEGNLRRHLYYRDVDGKTDGVKVGLGPLTFAWDTDGKSLIVTEAVPFKEIKDSGFSVWQVDMATKQKSKLDLPKHALVCAVMPDGKAFVAVLADFKAEKMHLALVSRDGKDVTKLCELRSEGNFPRPSPDGTKILFKDYDPDDKPAKDVPPLQRLFVYDLKAKTRTRLSEVPLNSLLIGYCWSPDGKKIAYTWKQVHPVVPLAVNTDNMNDPKLNTETESHLVICDETGKNPKTLLSMKSEFAPRTTIGAVDWQ